MNWTGLTASLDNCDDCQGHVDEGHLMCVAPLDAVQWFLGHGCSFVCGGLWNVECGCHDVDAWMIAVGWLGCM